MLLIVHKIFAPQHLGFFVAGLLLFFEIKNTKVSKKGPYNGQL